MVTHQTDENTGHAPKQSAQAVRSIALLWHNSEFRKRVISAVILAPIVLGAIISGGVWFYALMLLVAVYMMREWDALTAFRNSAGWGAAGVFYVILTCICLIRLREEALGGSIELLLFLLLIVWSTDIGAYFSGKLIGGVRLVPSISPNKTWAGLLGGMGAAMLVSVILSIFFAFPPHIAHAIWMGPLLAIVAQTGDIFESWMKRKAGVKDSGHLIPGHGGILDRVDGFTFSAPLLVILHILMAVPTHV
jgi:phosphatidate cytidylyltransferase